MKKPKPLLLLGALLCAVGFISGCSNTDPTGEGPTLNKLKFVLSTDKKFYAVSAKDKDVSGKIVIPDEYESLPVRQIGYQGFSGCNQISSVTIPDSVTSMGVSAFSRCANLESVILGKNILVIPEKAFNSCEKLREVIVEQPLAKIG